jgi:hypothetical protein
MSKGLCFVFWSNRRKDELSLTKKGTGDNIKAMIGAEAKAPDDAYSNATGFLAN